MPGSFKNAVQSWIPQNQPSPTLLQGSRVELHPFTHAQFASLNCIKRLRLNKNSLTGSHQSSIGNVSRVSAPAVSLLEPFLFLFDCLCRRRSFPPCISGSLGQSWSRISAAFCVQPVYTSVLSGCIHSVTFGRYSSSSCLFGCRCQHNCCPLYSKCAHSDCPFWLSCISVIVRAHFRASCLWVCWLPSCTKFLFMSR